MIRHNIPAKTLSCLLLASLLLAGCLGRSAPQVAYFSLMTMEQLGDTQRITALPEVSLGVGPMTIPESLKRSQVATRSQGNLYRFDEFNRWAGMLEKDIATVMGDNLAQLLGIDKVAQFPWLNHFTPTYRITVDIQQLDGELAGEAILIARWAVADASGKKLLAAKKSVYRQPLAAADFATLVKTESLLVAALSREIAAEVATLAK